MKIWHISDTHTLHDEFKTIPEVDMVFHSGDCSNEKDSGINANEVLNFIDWFKNLPIKHKIFVAGNHDTSIERRLVKKSNFETNGIIYLENDDVVIDGIKIWGSPITPTFGTGWAFNKDRAKIHNVWEMIPEDTDVLIVHGPPKGIRDLSYDRKNILEMCGDTALAKKVFKLKDTLGLMCFGHIHNFKDCYNQGVSTFHGMKTIFSNATCVVDKQFKEGLASFGNILEI